MGSGFRDITRAVVAGGGGGGGGSGVCAVLVAAAGGDCVFEADVVFCRGSGDYYGGP